LSLLLNKVGLILFKMQLTSAGILYICVIWTILGRNVIYLLRKGALLSWTFSLSNLTDVMS
ncbi:hypothetical protein, partial [Salmonella sp. s54412]|uniref:hypothetical protein n=1 Tax=Salmonella sp. s54412 TaxID=3160128 RepID=UPI0037547365